jgi:vancomycin resistance protein VanJ
MNIPSSPAPNAGANSPLRGNSFLQRIVSCAIFAYAGLLTILFLVMEIAGERWWPMAVLLYLPQQIFLLPLIVLIPAALYAEPPIGAYAALAVAVIIYLWHVPFYPGMGSDACSMNIKIVTNNYAQNHHLSIQPFIAAEDPDFVALEDSHGLAQFFQHAYPDRSVAGVDQFVFISKTPIKSATTLAWPLWRGFPVAAVFDVDWHGHDLAIYAVHLPSPRSDFAKLARLGLLKEILGRNRRLSDNMSFGESMTARAQLARDLAGVFAREKRPFVAVGDFNMPPDGYVHSVLTEGLADCFIDGGRGFGFTFPGDTHNPLTLGQPWLRIDYVLVGPGWRTVDCQVESGRRSKHRAVVATLTRD